MTPEQIGKAYDSITHLWQNKRFDRNNGLAQLAVALQFVDIDDSAKGRALDVGCGCTGRFADVLVENNFDYTGLDISKEKIKLARERNPKQTFLHADICAWTPTTTYDVITAWDSIWHIPLQAQTEVITKLVGALKPKGVFIFSFGGLDKPGEHTDATMGPEVYYSSLGTQGFLSLFLRLECQVRHLEFDQHPELHTYMVVQKS